MDLDRVVRNSPRAELPAIYRKARSVLQQCVEIDECKKWSNQAEALASYAKQAKDDSLRRMCDRIQARAIRRAGELIKRIPPAKGGVPYHTTTRGGAPPSRHTTPRWGDKPSGPTPSRRHVARSAGMSDDQRKTALRVANIPDDTFERLVESQEPPTVTALSDIGIYSYMGQRTPEELKEVTRLLTTFDRLVKGYIDNIDIEKAVEAMTDAERHKLSNNIQHLWGWISRIATELNKAAKGHLRAV